MDDRRGVGDVFLIRPTRASGHVAIMNRPRSLWVDYLVTRAEIRSR